MHSFCLCMALTATFKSGGELVQMSITPTILHRLPQIRCQIMQKYIILATIHKHYHAVNISKVIAIFLKGSVTFCDVFIFMRGELRFRQFCLSFDPLNSIFHSSVTNIFLALTQIFGQNLQQNIFSKTS